ncbi:MAG: SCO family protein [Chitinophagaceae bacterium]
MNKKTIFYIGFFALLVVAFLIALSFVIPNFTKSKLPPINTVKPFAFLNQDGQTVTDKTIDGKVVVVNYFFTTCKSVCPRMNNDLKPVYETFKNEPDFLMLSHTCDPERDSVPVLKHYADSMQVNTSKWQFLTGRKDSLYRMARYSYSIDDPANNVQNINDDFLHTQFVALVNKNGDVVKVYDGLKPTELKEMTERIKKLLKE